MKKVILFLSVLIFSCQKEKVKNSSPIDNYVDIYVSSSNGTIDLLNPILDNSFSLSKIQMSYNSYSNLGFNYITTGLGNHTILLENENGTYVLRIFPALNNQPILNNSEIKITWPDKSEDVIILKNKPFGNGGWVTIEIKINDEIAWDESNNSEGYRSVFLKK